MKHAAPLTSPTSDTITLDGPPPAPDGQPAEADAPTVRLWRHELVVRAGERPVQGASAFDIEFPPWPAPQQPIPTVPGYDILGELGRGGMGVVFKARQVRLNRLVALKMIHADELSDPDTLARFRTEAEAVARLQHPNIVQIYEVGEAEGRPYFSLEYVGGGSLAQRAAGQPQPPAEAAAIVEVLARAVHYAHSQGVIHRDLKPGNILLASGECEPAGSPNAGESGGLRPPLAGLNAKVADFGLAKYPTAANPNSPSGRGLIVGTPQYMAPESYINPATVGPVADVYALGAILYELLTGRPPFQGANAVDTLLQVRLLQLIPPRVWQPKTPRDLETITLKSLEKEPRLRYSSARELAEDLRRYLDGLPIRARPSSLTERAWKATRRHPALTLLGMIGAVLFVIMFAGMAWRWRLAEDGRLAAVRDLSWTAGRLAESEHGLYLSRIAQAHDHARAGRFASAAELLRQCLPQESRADLRGWEWYYLQRYCANGREPVAVLPNRPDGIVVSGFRGVTTEALNPDGRRLATVGVAGSIVLRDAATHEEILTLRIPQMTGDLAGTRLTFSDDGRRLTATWSGGAAVWDSSPHAIHN